MMFSGGGGGGGNWHMRHTDGDIDDASVWRLA